MQQARRQTTLTATKITIFGYAYPDLKQPIQAAIDSSLTDLFNQTRNIDKICLIPLVQMNVGFALMG
jgi:hypothetical protein